MECTHWRIYIYFFSFFRQYHFFCITIINSELESVYWARHKLKNIFRWLLLLIVTLFVTFLLIVSSLLNVIPVPTPFAVPERCKELQIEHIPKHIHQTWKTSQLPSKWQAYQQHCQRINPGYNYTLWTDQDIDTLIHTHYPWLEPLYKSYTYSISRADVARYVILHHFGGIYIDIDIDCYTPFDTFINESSGIETMVLAVNPFGLTNYFMVSKKRSDFLHFMLEGLADAKGWYGVPYMTVITSTGPVFVYNRYMHYNCPERVRIIPLHIFQKSFFHGNQNSWMYWDGKAAAWMAQHYVLCRNIFYFSLIVTVVWSLLKCKRIAQQHNTCGMTMP